MDNNSSYNERELLSKIASGDQRAFTEIVGRYTSIIYAHLLSYTKAAQKAEEVTQDIFISLWRNRSKLVEIENFPAYIYAVTRNRASSALKERLQYNEPDSEDKLQHILVQPQLTLELKELAVMLNRAIDSLPARRKEVFLLSRMENMTYDQIAGQLKISRSAVRQHVVAALVFLRDYLKEHGAIIVSALFSIITMCLR